MNKLLWSIVPACITFGPLFMTRIGGTARADWGDGLAFGGAFMLVAGLVIMFKAIAAQQRSAV